MRPPSNGSNVAVTNPLKTHSPMPCHSALLLGSNAGDAAVETVVPCESSSHSMEKASLGKPQIVQLRIFTGSPKQSWREDEGGAAKAASERASSNYNYN